MKQFRNRKFLVFALLLLCTVYSRAYAQIQAAMNPDNTLMVSPSSNFIDMETLNTDMVTVGSGDKMTAVAIQGLTSLGGYNGIHVECGGFSQDVTMSGAMNPDIVIADNTDPNAILGEDYLVTVVYEYHPGGNSEIRMEVFEFSGMGTGSAGYVRSKVYTISGPDTYYKVHPHIDLWGDRNNVSVNNMQQLHDYILIWESASGVEYVYGTLFPGGSSSVSTTYTAVADAINSDVAAQTILTPVMNGPERTAWISYIEQTTATLKVLQLDFDNTLAPSGSSSTLLDNTHSFSPILPRIEAQPLADVTPNVATWTVAAAELGPITFIPKVYVFNDAGGVPPGIAFDVTAAGSGNNGIDYYNRSPCVAGVGPNMVSSASGVGASQFSVGYFSTYTHNPFVMGSDGGDYYSNSIDISGGNWSSTYNQYYEVNSDDIYGAVGGYFLPDHQVTMAVTSSSNTGDDLYTVWFTGKDGSNNGAIKYKFSGNSYAYKTNGINNLAAKKTYRVFPNPSVDHLVVEGLFNADYTIINMTGAAIAQGKMDTNHNVVDTRQLLPGVYLLNLTENGYTQRVKFTKQ